MMVSPHSITANAPGLHRNAKNGSMMIGEPANHARSMFAVHSPTGRRTERPMHWQKPEDVIGAARPFTGAQYLESLRDGREVYIYGERVDDVTTHPAFRNATRSIARLYDALHDEKSKAV